MANDEEEELAKKTREEEDDEGKKKAKLNNWKEVVSCGVLLRFSLYL